MLNTTRKMPLVSHLNELRRRLMISIGFFLAAASVCFTKVEYFSNELIALAKGFEFIYVAPAELLMSYIMISVICGMVLSLPVICYQLWKFIRPGLMPKERKAGVLVLIFGMILFFGGAAFAYVIVLPFTLKFFVALNTQSNITAMVSVQNYLNFVVTILVTFGTVFELPIVIILLTQIGLINPKIMRKQRKYAILVIFILAAIITPPDVTSQILVAVPMIVLFEVSTIVSSILFHKKLAKLEKTLGEESA
jgi:sec-independent protein translocase protein TatC